MKIPEIFNRDELSRTLWGFRYEFMVAGVFSMVANLLMLTPTVYMLQVYDRVMLSQNTGTLLVVSLITLFFFGVLTFAEWSRSKLLVSSGVRMDELLSKRLFHASYEAYLNPEETNPSRSFNDLTEVRQFLTGNGIFAFFDAPWAPIYIAVLFMLHPWLGVMALGFGAVQCVLAWWGNSASKPAQADASKAQIEVGGYLQSKFRNAEVLEPMGMVDHLYRRWAAKNNSAMGYNLHAQSVSGKVVAWSKFVRYTQQSLALGGGALLVIQGELSTGAMIAANVLMTRALAPIDLMVSTWGGFLTARDAFVRLSSLLEAHPLREVAPVGEVPQGDVILKVGGREVKNVPQLQEQVAKYRPGDKVKVGVWRDKKWVEIEVALKNRSGRAELNDFAADAEANFSSLGADFVQPSAEEMQKLRIKGGAKIKTLNQGKLRSAGIQQGFIVTKIDDTMVDGPNTLKEALSSKAKGEGILIEGVYPNGTRAYYGFGL